MWLVIIQNYFFFDGLNEEPIEYESERKYNCFFFPSGVLNVQRMRVGMDMELNTPNVSQSLNLKLILSNCNTCVTSGLVCFLWIRHMTAVSSLPPFKLICVTCGGDFVPGWTSAVGLLCFVFLQVLRKILTWMPFCLFFFFLTSKRVSKI